MLKNYTHIIGGVALGLYMILSVSHYRLMISWNSGASLSPALIFIGLLLLLIACFSTGTAFKANRLTSSSWLVLAFFLWALLVGLFFINLPSMASSAAALVVVFFFLSFQDDVRNGQVLSIAAVALCGYVAYLYIMLPVRFGFTLGSIPPNQFAKLGLAVMVLAHATKSWVRYVSIFVACSGALISTSRASIVFVVVFLVLFYLPSRPKHRAVTIAVSALILFAVVFVDDLFNYSIFGSLGNRVLLLNDPNLGLGSGFSGRSEHWSSGLSAVFDNPFGWGYNTRGEDYAGPASEINAHQGFINMTLDAGIIGLAIFFAATLSFLRTSSRLAHRNDVVRTGFAAAIGYLLVMIFDPIYFSLTVPLSLVFLGFLATGFGRPLRIRF